MRAAPRARPILVAALAGLAALAAAGVAQSILAEGRAPFFSASYSSAIDQRLGRGDLEGALGQMSLAIDMNADDPGVARFLEPMARLAHDLGKPDEEVHALRRLVRNSPRDVSLRVRLAQALLSKPSRSTADLREAADQAEAAVTLDPRCVDGWLALSFVARCIGQNAQAADLLARARRIDPEAGNLLAAP